MAKLKAPLLSMGASGQIGKSMVIGTWRGIPYARQHITPANPRTTAQTTQRTLFKNVDDLFKRSLTLAQAPWQEAAKGKKYTARNAFIAENVPALKGDSDLSDFVASPSVNGGLPASSFSATGGASSGEIDVDVDVGQAPVDWEQPYVTFLAIEDQDPANAFSGFVIEAQETGAGASYSPPQTISHTFSGLTAGTDYLVAAFLQWTRADGTTAYGASSASIVTATA